MLPYLSTLPSTLANTPEHRTWTQKLLVRHCMLSSRHVTSNMAQPQDLLSTTSPTPPESLLSPFRAFADRYQSNAMRTTGQDTSYAHVWQAYYDTVSIFVRYGMVLPIFKSKFHQAAELKMVQAMYETALLKEFNFPRADQANSQIESWVDQVMANWRVLCGSAWQNDEIGEGGKAALSHVVLDVGTI